MADEARVVILMAPELRDEIKSIGKSEGRVLMRQIEHICKKYVADRKAKAPK
jgi:phage FluMu protein gp41